MHYSWYYEKLFLLNIILIWRTATCFPRTFTFLDILHAKLQIDISTKQIKEVDFFAIYLSESWCMMYGFVDSFIQKKNERSTWNLFFMRVLLEIESDMNVRKSLFQNKTMFHKDGCIKFLRKIFLNHYTTNWKS